MSRKEAGYPLKAPRGRPHDLAARTFDYIEDAIYVVVAALLLLAGVFVLIAVVTSLVGDLGKAGLNDPLTLVTTILDKGLLLFIIAELLHTVRATIQERTLVVEPFLIVGLIAGVRRLLLLTAQLATNTSGFTWSSQGIEMSVLLGLIVGMTIALVLYHRYHGPAMGEHEGADR